MGAFENRIVNLIEEILASKAVRQKTFDWLLNTHMSVENKQAMDILDCIFIALSGDKDKLLEKRRRKLRVDAYFEKENLAIEIDELQHFTEFRLKTLNFIKPSKAIDLGFNIDEYKCYCQENYTRAIEKGQSGYRKPKSEFPFEYGRAYQRAYFDSMRDVLFPVYLKKPIIRISELELMCMDNDGDLRKYIEGKLKNYVEIYKQD
jgi:hypothetical protein